MGLCAMLHVCEVERSCFPLPLSQSVSNYLLPSTGPLPSKKDGEKRRSYCVHGHRGQRQLGHHASCIQYIQRLQESRGGRWRGVCVQPWIQGDTTDRGMIDIKNNLGLLPKNISKVIFLPCQMSTRRLMESKGCLLYLKMDSYSVTITFLVSFSSDCSFIVWELFIRHWQALPALFFVNC